MRGRVVGNSELPRNVKTGLRQVAGAVAGQGATGAWFAAAARNYLAHAHQGLQLNDALDQALWQARETSDIRCRAARLRAELVAEALSGLQGSNRARAEQLAQLASRYAKNAWPHESGRETAPNRASTSGVLWRLHDNARRSGLAWPLGWRRLLDLVQPRPPRPHQLDLVDQAGG